MQALKYVTNPDRCPAPDGAQSSQACAQPLQVFLDLQAGTYRFSTMLAGQTDQSAAQTVFTVDTIGPDVTITSSPDAINNGGVVSFAFVSEGASSFQCRWVNVTAGTTTDPFDSCRSPA